MNLILIVEDSEACASTLEIALSAIPGCRVISASSVEEARRQMERQKFCAVVTDIHLPGADGFEFVAFIRSQPRLVSLPVVVISGDPAPDTARLALERGADAYFAKPYSPAAVRAKLEELLHAS